MFFPRLLDRFWQNLRRCAGLPGAVLRRGRAQRRLAPHLHAAIRGAIPRATLKPSCGATYHQVWWPPLDQGVRRHRRRCGTRGRGLRRPGHRHRLPTWGQALDALDADPDAAPAHVVRFGSQLDIQGMLAGSADADRAVRYLCKYLTKAVADTCTPRRRADRPGVRAPSTGCTRGAVVAVFAAVRELAALRRPTRRQPGPGLVPGHCPWPAHDRDNLGLGGRRVLVSRAWTGKTLTQHRADRADVVRAALGSRRHRPRRKRAGWPPTPSTRTAGPGSCGKTCRCRIATTPRCSPAIDPPSPGLAGAVRASQGARWCRTPGR